MINNNQSFNKIIEYDIGGPDGEIIYKNFKDV